MVVEVEEEPMKTQDSLTAAWFRVWDFRCRVQRLGGVRFS